MDRTTRWETEALRKSQRRRDEPAGPDIDLREAPPASMVVPLDAWNRMLDQLGHLHEAGQQLADARERAAKAETEVHFLRERLAELRRAAPVPTPAPEEAAAAAGEQPGRLPLTARARAAAVAMVKELRGPRD